jgi:hypothetical protein
MKEIKEVQMDNKVPAHIWEALARLEESRLSEESHTK